MLPSLMQARDPRKATAFLSSNGTLSATAADFQAAVLAGCRWREFESGDVITNADDADRAVFGIVYGAVAFVPALGPFDAQIANVLHAGDWFGYSPIITGRRRSATVTARSPVLLAVIAGTCLKALLDSHPAWWRHMAQMAVDYGDTSTNVAADLMIADSERRCAATLLRLAGCRFQTPTDRPAVALVNQSELGAIANLSRNSVNRILGDIARRGLVTIGHKHVVLHNPDTLRALVNEG